MAIQLVTISRSLQDAIPDECRGPSVVLFRLTIRETSCSSVRFMTDYCRVALSGLFPIVTICAPAKAEQRYHKECPVILPSSFIYFLAWFASTRLQECADLVGPDVVVALHEVLHCKQISRGKKFVRLSTWAQLELSANFGAPARGMKDLTRYKEMLGPSHVLRSVLRHVVSEEPETWPGLARVLLCVNASICQPLLESNDDENGGDSECMFIIRSDPRATPRLLSILPLLSPKLLFRTRPPPLEIQRFVAEFLDHYRSLPVVQEAIRRAQER